MPRLSPDAWAQIGTTLFNTVSQLYTNQQNRKNALSDWQRQNEYNAPAQQMRRFQEAGLNPNLIYKQTNEAAPVRSTDFVAPQLNEGLLDVLGKSNAIEVQNLNKEGLRLRNENQELQNDILRDTINEQKEKYGIQNRVQNATYDNLIAGANLKRQELSQKNTINPLEAIRLERQNKLLDLQFQALSQNTQFQKLSQPIQLEIAKITKDNLEKTGKAIDTSTQLKEFQMRMNTSLENLGIGTGLVQDILKILVNKIF
jgi:hypothetical protein